MAATLKHATKYDADAETWTVLDADGDECDWAETEAEARGIAADLDREARVAALREQLEETLADCEDAGRLEAALAALRGG